MRKTQRAFKAALAAAEAANDPAAAGEVRLDFAEWLKDRQQFQEVYEQQLPVVEGPEPSFDKRLAQTAILYLEAALRVKRAVDRPLFVARLDRALESASSLEIGVALRGAAVILFILADWREAASVKPCRLRETFRSSDPFRSGSRSRSTLPKRSPLVPYQMKR